MTFTAPSYVAIILAAVASFAFGAAFYMSLAKHWLDAIGFQPDVRAKLERGERDPKPFIVSIVGELVMAWVLAGIIGHLGPGNQYSIANGVVSGAFVWLGFVATTVAVNNAYGMRALKLTLIDAAHWLGVLIIQGAVIGWWGAR
jgi:hypothetical protein